MNNKHHAANFPELFEKIEKNCPADKPFVIAETTLTYGLAVERIKRLSSLYHNMGLRASDRVIIATRNDTDLIVFFLSLLRCGIAAVIVDPETKPVRLKALIKKSEAKAIAADLDLRKDWFLDNEQLQIIEIKKATVEKNTLLKKLIQSKPIEKDETAYPFLLENILPMDKTAELDKGLDAYILFTSGTISEPKGVTISHKNLFAHLATLSKQFDHSPDSRILNTLPLDHTDGLIQGPMIAFFNGATVFRPMKFSIQNIGSILDSVYTYRITHFETVPTMLALINKLATGYEESFATADFRFIICSAGYLETTLWESFEKRFKTRVANFYGLTETVTGGIFCGPTDNDYRTGTIGKPADCEVRIVDENGDDVPGGAVGEIIMKGDNIMKGYCNAPEETGKVLKDGWFYTGDLGSRDDNGFYRIAGRKKSIIKSGGMNINPYEITEVVNMHPNVLESTTIGYPDDTWGEIVVACVVYKSNGALPDGELIEFIRKYLEPYKIPARICVMPSLPKRPSGKIQTDELKRIAGKLLKGSDAAEGIDVETGILQTAAKCFHVNMGSLRIEYGPAELTGWDSLAHLEFVTAMEERFSIRFSTSEIMRIERLSDAETIVSSKLNG